MITQTFVDYGLMFEPLMERGRTDLIVIHHTGNPTDDDLSAEEIHESHLAQGWAGIGYHLSSERTVPLSWGVPWIP